MDLKAYVLGAPRRLLLCLITLPRPRDLLELAAALLVLAVVVVPAGLATGLLAIRPRPLAELAPMALAAVIAPALGEELPFRGLLVPGQAEAIPAAWPILLSTALFCLWHVLEAETFIPAARAEFLRADFLAWTVLLGFTCALLRRRSGSIWPAVALHWLAVVAWEGWLGGPGFAAQR